MMGGGKMGVRFFATGLPHKRGGNALCAKNPLMVLFYTIIFVSAMFFFCLHKLNHGLGRRAFPRSRMRTCAGRRLSLSGSPCPAGADYVGDILSRKLPDIPVPVIAVGVAFVIIDIQERVGENNYGGLKAQPTVPLLVQLVPVLFPGRMEAAIFYAACSPAKTFAAVLNVIPLCFPMLCSSL